MRLRPLPLLGFAAALAAGFACGPLTGDLDGGIGSDPPAEEEFSTADLEHTWIGISHPSDPYDKALELTLAFEAYGEATNAVGLTHYSFPSPLPPGDTVEYLEMIDTYDLFFYPDGRLVLDTVVEYYTSLGIFVSERVFKELRMSADRTRLEGTEAIEVFENGNLTILYDGWLILDRQD